MSPSGVGSIAKDSFGHHKPQMYFCSTNLLDGGVAPRNHSHCSCDRSVAPRLHNHQYASPSLVAFLGFPRFHILGARDGTKGSANQNKSIRTMAFSSSVPPVAGNASAELSRRRTSSSRAKLSTALGVVFRKRWTKKVTIKAESTSSFEVLRVRKFFLDKDVEAGSWRDIGVERPCASRFNTKTTIEEGSESIFDTFAQSRFSDKEVVQGPVYVGSPDGQDIGRKSLVSRIKKICGVKSATRICDDVMFDERFLPTQVASNSTSAASSPTLAASSGMFKKDEGSSKGKERLTSEEILGIDTRSMLKRLTDPHG